MSHIFGGLAIGAFFIACFTGWAMFAIGVFFCIIAWIID